MARQQTTAEARRTCPAPAVVTPLTKVNLALPFSKITVEEPGKDLAELASVVAALAAVMGVVVSWLCFTALFFLLEGRLAP